eukprot:3160330-Pyramimonas_sp.AAC.1
MDITTFRFPRSCIAYCAKHTDEHDNSHYRQLLLSRRRRRLTTLQGGRGDRANWRSLPTPTSEDMTHFLNSCVSESTWPWRMRCRLPCRAK